MSGLLPRTQTQSGNGSFDNLSVTALVVSGAAYINNLSTSVFSPSQITTAQVNGNPSLTVSTGVTPTAALTIASAGIALDNTSTRLLAFSPSDNLTLVYKNNVADTSSVQTFTNKTLDSGSNTITLTSGSLAATNINSVLNQALLTTSTPTFGVTTISYSGSQAGLALDNTNVGATTSGVVCRVNGTSTLNLGVNASTNEGYLYTFPATPIKFGTASTERMRIDAGGITNDNTVTNILALGGGGTSLRTKTNVADTSSTQTFTNKTIDSGSNTLTITNSPLSAANVNTLINQAVLTTSTPTFGLTTITYSSAGVCGLQVNNTNGAATAGGMMCLNNGVQGFEVGTNNSTNEAYLFNHQNTAMTFGTNFVERMRIDGGGITNDNTVTNILALGGGGTSLRTKTNVADTSSTQTFTNKTIDSGSNTLTITNSPLSAANVNTLLNQAVMTTSTPTFGITTISYATSAGGLVIDNTNVAATTSGVVCRVNGTSTLNMGVNASTSEAYLSTLTAVPLKFLTNATERFRIDTSGTATYSNVNTVVQTLGTNNTFQLGTKSNYSYSSTINSYFNGAAAGDINLQNTDGTKGINIGVGAGTAQFNLNSTTIALSVNTVKQNIGTNNTYALGTKADYAYSSGAGTYFSSSAIGDINVRNTDTTKSLNLGVGSGTAQVSIGNALITTNVTLKPNVAADETALNWAAINASGNLVTRAISSGTFSPTWTTSSGFTAGPVLNQIDYNRVGNVVNCTGTLTGMGVAVGGNAGTLTLPITPASFASALNAAGTITASDNIGGSTIAGFVSATLSATTVQILVKNPSLVAGTVDLWFSFSYQLS